MYLITIHVPIYVDGDKKYIATDWHRSLILLRNSIGPHFGPIVVLAPYLPVSRRPPEQLLDSLTESEDEIQLVPSFNRECNFSSYWLNERHIWIQHLRTWVAKAQVVHSGMDDVYRPISFRGQVEGARQNKPTVFVSDTDIVLQLQQLSQGSDVSARWKTAAYCAIYDRMHRYAVKRASLSLLKGLSLADRYGKYARNYRLFHDTSFLSNEIVPERTVLERLQSLRGSRPLRLVYCGRLLQRKGLIESVTLVASARTAGANVVFDIIGDGPERERLEQMIALRNLSGCVRLLGGMRYGADLLNILAKYDALLLTPLGEDTPRVIFDAYAAGLPIIGTAFPYLQELAAEDGATLLLPFGNLNESAQQLARIVQDRGPLDGLTHKAMCAARHHAADEWYRRRAEWTLDAVDRHHAAQGKTVHSI